MEINEQFEKANKEKERLLASINQAVKDITTHMEKLKFIENQKHITIDGRPVLVTMLKDKAIMLTFEDDNLKKNHYKTL